MVNMGPLLVFFVLFVLSYLNGTFLIRHLRIVHNKLWLELNEPSLAKSNVGKSRLQLMSFVWRFRFLDIRDTTLTIYCVVGLVLEVGIMLTFAWLILAQIKN